MSRVAVVGAGTMGNGIAHVFAQHGWDTTLIDVAPGLLERVIAVIRANFERQVKKGTVTSEQRDAALARIRTSMSLDAVSDAEPLVEVIRGLETRDETVAQVVEIAKGLEKTPVVVNDAPGFVSNRVLMPMINEAIFCVMEGVATPEAIDTVMKLGMNHPLGPLALADLIGLDVCLAILEVLQRDLGDDKYRAAPLLRTMVAAGRLGRKSGRGFYVYRD